LLHAPVAATGKQAACRYGAALVVAIGKPAACRSGWLDLIPFSVPPCRAALNPLVGSAVVAAAAGPLAAGLEDGGLGTAFAFEDEEILVQRKDGVGGEVAASDGDGDGPLVGVDRLQRRLVAGAVRAAGTLLALSVAVAAEG